MTSHISQGAVVRPYPTISEALSKLSDKIDSVEKLSAGLQEELSPVLKNVQPSPLSDYSQDIPEDSPEILRSLAESISRLDRIADYITKTASRLVL